MNKIELTVTDISRVKDPVRKLTESYVRQMTEVAIYQLLKFFATSTNIGPIVSVTATVLDDGTGKKPEITVTPVYSQGIKSGRNEQDGSG